jgi:rod shape-determining protein MreD
MRRIWKFLLLPIVFFIQQLPGVSGWGIDLPLIFVALIGLRTVPSEAAAWGFLMGTLQDLLSAGWLGPNCIAKTCVGIASSFSEALIYHEKVSTQTFLVFGCSVMHQVLIYALMMWDGSAPGGGDALLIGLRSILMTTLAGALVSFILVRFRRRRYDPATA